MHILEAYFNRETALPSTTQVGISALERGAEVWVTCTKCEGAGKLPYPKLRKNGRKSRYGDICPNCSGKGRHLRRFDAIMKLWREGLCEQTRICRYCLGVSGKSECEECGGDGYTQALDANPQGAHEASTYGSSQESDVAADIGWQLKRLAPWAREIVEAWFQPRAVSYRRRCGDDAGHAVNAPLLPFTYLGRLAADLERRGDTARADALIDAALAEAETLRRRAFREYNDARLVHTVSRGECRGREMQYGRF